MYDNSSIVKDNRLCSTSDGRNATGSSETGSDTLKHVYYQAYDHKPRIVILWVLAILGILGNTLVMAWICSRVKRTGRRRPAITSLVANLMVADILVLVFATCTNLVMQYEPANADWRYGDVSCRLFKFVQTTVICSSNYQVVVLAIDRLYAVRRPLHDQLTAFKLCGTAWILAAAVCFCSLFLYRATCDQGVMLCKHILYDYAYVHMQTYLTIMLILVMLLPFVAISICYVCIFKKFSDRTSKDGVKPGKIQLQATPSARFQKAKNKTLKMTVVILALFLGCTTPYCICEIWRIFFDNGSLPTLAYAIMPTLLIANSSLNPFVFLIFNASTFLKSKRAPRTSTNSRTTRTTVSRTRSENNHANEANGEVLALRNT